MKARRPRRTPLFQKTRKASDGDISVVVFSPANLNAIDGSSVWTQTITLALAGVVGARVSILLSHPITNDRLARPLFDHPGVQVINPKRARAIAAKGSLSLEEAAAALSSMASRLDVLIVRGAEVAERLAREPALRGKLWPYLTDVPQRTEEIDDLWRTRMAEIMDASQLLLCQTEELRGFLEESFESVAGRGRVVPPIIPDDVSAEVLGPPTTEALTLCYSGKFARHWNTYEMCAMPGLLADRGITATLIMVGDKINRDPDWPEYVGLMKERLESSPGVTWVGGVSRSESMRFMARSHLGLSWRSKELDDSLELSTKLLEYCAAGTPPVLNRTPMHERIFGSDYPLFVDDTKRVEDLLVSVASGEISYEGLIATTSHISEEYTTRKASARLQALLLP